MHGIDEKDGVPHTSYVAADGWTAPVAGPRGRGRSEVSCSRGYRMSASTLADGPGCDLPLKHVSSIPTDAVMSLQEPSKGFPEMLRYVLGCRH